jgi:hypothetical protein
VNKTKFTDIKVTELFHRSLTQRGNFWPLTGMRLDVCVTVHHQYNDASNQQDATTFSFINLF